MDKTLNWFSRILWVAALSFIAIVVGSELKLGNGSQVAVCFGYVLLGIFLLSVITAMTLAGILVFQWILKKLKK